MKRAFVILKIIIFVFCLTACQVSMDDIISKNSEKLTQTNPYLRKQAIAALGGTGDERVILLIAPMLNDQDVEVAAQADQELNELRDLGLPVNKKILAALDSFNEEQRDSITKYLITVHQHGVDLQQQLLATLPMVDFDINLLTNIIVYLHTRPDSSLYAHLLAGLVSENGGISAEALLLLDKNGYPPQAALIDEIIAQGATVSEAVGQLLVQFACRESYVTQHGQEEQLQIYFREGVVIVTDNSKVSQKRCATGDDMWHKTPADLSWASRLAFLLTEDNTPQTVENLFADFINADRVNMAQTLARDMDSFRDSLDVHQVLVQTLADNSLISDWLETELRPADTIAVLATPIEEEDPVIDNTQGILALNSLNGELMDVYHWHLPSAFRPQKQEDIRYILSVSEEKEQVSLIDLSSREIIAEETFPLDNVKTLIDRLLVLIEGSE